MRAYLSPRVVLDEGDLAGHVDLCFLFGDLLFLVCLRDRTIPAAVLDHIFEAAEEGGMTMKVDVSIVGLVPLGIEDWQ